MIRPWAQDNQLQDIHLDREVRHCQGWGSRPALVSELETEVMLPGSSRTRPMGMLLLTQKASDLASIHPTKALSSRKHCGSLPGHCLGNQRSFESQQIYCASQRLPSPQPPMVLSSPREILIRHPELLDHRAVSASCSSCAQPPSVVHTMPFRTQRRENKDNMYYGWHRPGRTETAPSGGASGKMDTHSFIHLWWAQAQLSLGLLFKEVTVFLLLQLAVVPLDLPVGLFHIIIHELVHEWVKIGLVPKEVNKLGAIVKVACR